MSTTGQHRTRAQRVAASVNYVGTIARLHGFLWDDHGLLKVGLIFLASLVICFLIQAWNPPFGFRYMTKTNRDIVCRTPFSVSSPDKTEEARRNARIEALHVYAHDPTILTQFKAGLVNGVQSLLSAGSYASMKEEQKAKWKTFLPPNTPEQELSTAFDRFQKTFETDVELARFKQTLDQVFASYEKNGILVQLHGFRDGNQERIAVYDLANPDKITRDVPVIDVMIGNAYMIKDRLNQRYDWNTSELLFQWIRQIIPETLSENKEATLRAKEAAAAKVGTIYTKYEPGQAIVKQGQQIDFNAFELLKQEYRNIIKDRTSYQKTVRLAGCLTLIFIMLSLSYVFILKRLDRSKYPQRLKLFLNIYGLVVVTILLGRIIQVVSGNQMANPELIPLLIFVQYVTVAISWEVAICTGFVAAFILAMSINLDLGMFLILVGTTSVIVVLSRDIRTRGKIIVIATCGALTVFFTSICIGLLRNQVFSDELLFESLLRMVWTMLAGFLFAGLLPSLERIFEILTPMRLQEIGNPSHPLLQELASRAPATYNHSMQTAALADTAAEAIGARVELVRVGAYFHDIGKMVNPKYFSENQDPITGNIHDTLEPRVSTLVIVAHVKDGIELARQYHLPQPIIDLIEQHHGSFLVSFFYDRANKSSMEGAYAQKLDESAFRYPGPKPQSREAAILMIADAVESACRALPAEAGPGRIENCVKNIIVKRLEDGQFDDANLTLGEIRTIENTMITAILVSRHSRIKYPDKDEKSDKDEKTVGDASSCTEQKPASSDTAIPSETGSDSTIISEVKESTP